MSVQVPDESKCKEPKKNLDDETNDLYNKPSRALA